MGAFAITAPDDLLLVQDLVMVRQQCTAVTVAFDDNSVADHLDSLVDQGIRPEQGMRVWVHTHPGDCPSPSAIDEDTFARCFGRTDWAVMFILAKGGESYARIRFRAGPSGAMQLPVEIAFDEPFEASQPMAWQKEYVHSVFVLPPITSAQPSWMPQRQHAMTEEDIQMSQETYWDHDYFWNTQEMIYDMY